MKSSVFITISAFMFLFIVQELFSQTVYITKSGKKYHSANCSSLRKSSIPIDLKDAVGRGYGACSKCNPPTLSNNSVTPKEKSASVKKSDANSLDTSGRCQAITKKGTQCTRKAKPGSKFCWQHGG